MSIYIVKAKKTSLKANFSPSDATLTLQELVDSQGNNLAIGSFGEWGAVVIKQGDTVEIVKFDDITQNANGSATLDVATSGRNILPITPYTGSSTGQNFLAGAEVIVTNDPLTMMTFGNLNNANVWELLQTFSVVPQTTGGDAVTANELIRKAQLDSAILGIATSVSIRVNGTAGETLVAGNLIYLKSADNRWWKVDADDPTTCNNVIMGIAQGAGTAGNAITNGLMLRGVDSNQTGLTAGVKYYASNTAGGISTSAGTTEVTVGISKSTTELYFEPRFDQQLTENQQDAMDNATSPSASNPFLTTNDTTGTGSVVRESVISAVAGSLFGDGNDGNVTIGAGTTTISRDMYYNNLTIETGGTLNPSGYRVFVKGTLTFQGTGKIARNGTTGSNGNNGGNASGGTPGNGGTGGAGGTALASGTIAGAPAGGDGATGGGGTVGTGNNGTNGNQATTPSNVTNAVGSTAVAGSGAGGNSGGGFNGNTGGNGGSAPTGGATVTNPTMMPRTAMNAISLHYYTNTTFAFMNGSAPSAGGSGGGGGAGGNQGASYSGGGGGGGGGAGGTGGVVMVCAYAVVGGYATCIQALGGTGGNGGNGGNPSVQYSGGGGTGGGGNGGTGGVVCFIYHSYSGTPLDTTCVAGGAGGIAGQTAGIAGTGGGSAGSLGNNGATGTTGKLYSIAV